MTGGMRVVLDDIALATGEDLDFGDTLEQDSALAMWPIEAKPAYIHTLALDLIVASSRMQTRAEFDPDNEPEDATFLNTIRDAGVMIPVHVVLIKENPEEYRLAAGHRRTAAARLAGQKTIPALVFPRGTKQKEIDKFTFTENFHRKDMKPMETARLLESMQEAWGWPQRDLANSLHISLGHANRLMALLKADKRIQTLVDEKQVSVSAAAQIGKLSEEQAGRAIAAIEDGAPASSAIELARQKSRHKTSIQKKKQGTFATISPEQLFVEGMLGKARLSEVKRVLGRRTAYKELGEIEKALVVLSCRQEDDFVAALDLYSVQAIPVRKALQRLMRDLVRLSAVGNRAHKKKQLQKMLTSLGIDWALAE